MEKIFDKFNVLLIEDNPKQIGGFEGADFLDDKGNKLFEDSFDDAIIPSVNLVEHHTDLSNHFNLKVLQHPLEVKEFIQLVRDAESELGFLTIGNLPGIVPDVVVFDYLLWQNIETNKTIDDKGSLTFNLHYNENSAPIRKFLNPNFELLKNLSSSAIRKLHLEENGEYGESDFINSINKIDTSTDKELSSEIYNRDKTELHTDDMGLYCGVSIWQLFRNHITVPIPATQNKDKIDKLKAHSKFLEWLYEHELGHIMQEQYRVQKTWADIIPKSVSCMRDRALTMASQFRIFFNLQNLLNLISEKHSKRDEKGERIEAGFTIITQYGSRTYYLDALFVDIVPEKRDKAISEFAEKCFNTFKNASTYTPSNDEIITSMRNANYLFEAYQSKAFWERLLFSKLYFIEENYRKYNPILVDDSTSAKDKKTKKQTQVENKQINLSADEEKLLNTFILNKNEEIKVKSTKKSFEVTNAKDLRTIEEGESINVRKLTVLFTILRLYRARQEFLKAETKVNTWNSKFGEQYPGLMECLHLIFPIPANPIILPIHSREVSASWTPYIDSLSFFGKLSDVDKGKDADMYLFHPDVNGSFFDKGTKSILIAYSNFINLKFDYLPKWLK